jgi:aminoglycoside phosphotransferase (APT) family kinase protein
MLLSCDREERRGIFFLKADVPLPDAALKGLAARGAALLAERCDAVAALLAADAARGPVQPLAAGTFHVVHARLGDDPVVVRSPIPGIFAEDLSLGVEREVRRWLGPAGDLVPETHRVGFAADGAPFDHAILSHVGAPTLRDAGDDLLDRQPSLLAGIGRALSAVHAVPGFGAGLLALGREGAAAPRGVHDDWAAYLRLHLDSHVDRCRAAGLVDAALAARIAAQFAGLEADVAGRPMCLLHGDPGNHNIAVDPGTGRVVALLDWEDALVGDPLFDAALWASFHPPRRHGAMFAAYAEAPVSAGERRLFALYFLRIALAKTVHRIRFGVADRPGYTPGHHRITVGVEMLEALA